MLPAFFLQRYTLEVEILRSLAMSLVFLPAATSDITLPQSTLFAYALGEAKPRFTVAIKARFDSKKIDRRIISSYK